MNKELIAITIIVIAVSISSQSASASILSISTLNSPDPFADLLTLNSTTGPIFAINHTGYIFGNMNNINFGTGQFINLEQTGGINFGGNDKITVVNAGSSIVTVSKPIPNNVANIFEVDPSGTPTAPTFTSLTLIRVPSPNTEKLLISSNIGNQYVISQVIGGSGAYRSLSFNIGSTQFLSMNATGVMNSHTTTKFLFPEGVTINDQPLQILTSGGEVGLNMKSTTPGGKTWGILQTSTPSSFGGGKLVFQDTSDSLTALTLDSNDTIVGGSSGNIVYRCATAGTLPVDTLTITAASCGTVVDTHLRVQ